MNNLNILKQKLQKTQGFLIENPLHLFYLTNSRIDCASLVITPDKAYYITDSRYIEKAEKEISKSAEVILQTKKSEQIYKILKNHGCNELMVETKYQTIFAYNTLKKSLPISKNDLLDITLQNMRAIKNENEIALMKQAADITQKCFLHMLHYIKPGISEKQLSFEAEMFMRQNGADGISFDIITIAGKNTSLPHGIPTDYLVQNGDFITLDMGCIYKEYCSDMTRTIGISSVSEKQKNVYSIVKDAQQAALDAVKNGVSCKDVDSAARDYITQKGFGEYFGHGTGHGVGLSVHEFPSVSKISEERLKTGMTITVEPGIYLPDEFGVRIEDTVLVTNTGYENFYNCSKDLILL